MTVSPTARLEVSSRLQWLDDEDDWIELGASPPF